MDWVHGLNSMKSLNKGFGVVLWSLFELQSSSFNTFNIWIIYIENIVFCTIILP